jgi:hypothetical protein
VIGFGIVAVCVRYQLRGIEEGLACAGIGYGIVMPGIIKAVIGDIDERHVGLAAGMVNDSSSDKFCPWNRHRWRVLLYLSRRANRPSGICSRFRQFNGDECGPARSGMRSVSIPSRRETNYSCALTVLKTQPRHFNGKETMSSPDLHYATLLVRDRVGRHGCVHRRSSFHGALSDNLGGKKGSRKQRPQLGSSPRQARHYRPSRAVQNRGDLLIRQLLKLAQQDYFAKIQR